MRTAKPLLPLLLGLSMHSQAQTFVSVGLKEATMNFKQNGAGALTIPIRTNLISFGNSSISLGTSLN